MPASIRSIVCVFSFLAVASVSAQAETLNSALAHAYQSNPDLEAARAGLRATDENIAIAKAGKRPQVAAELQGQVSETNGRTTRSAKISLSLNQALFDGFKTKNSILAANSRILSGRETLRSTEMDILIAGVQAYVDVLLNQQITNIRKQNLDFLQEQLRAAKARLSAGEGTRTDVSQAEAQLAASEARLTAARTTLRSARAIYKQVIGHSPRNLKVPSIPRKYIPRNLNQALGLAFQEHPALASARFTIEASEFDVKVAESALLPGVNLSASVSESDRGVTETQIGAQLSVPIYSGGANAALVRQSVERLGEAKIRRDSVRRQVEQIVIDAWVNLQSSSASIEAGNAEVKAARLALAGVIEERKVGQRTTLDVLNAQTNVLNAREGLVQSQRNAIVSAYNVLYTTGQLTANGLNLNVKRYDPKDHFEAVEDKWFGLRVVTD